MSAALVPCFGIDRIEPKRDREILDRIDGEVEAESRGRDCCALQ
ncbi:MAG TPA: hypothetical protein VLN61_07380 [Pseudolabrys sp.]|nr:hypothetical protein [Pseudolabrys sp.]